MIYKWGFWELTGHLCSYLLRLYLNLLKQPRRLLRPCEGDTTMSLSLQVVCLAYKVHIPQEEYWVSRFHTEPQRSDYGWAEDENHPRLASSLAVERSLVILGIFKLLSTIYLQLFWCSKPPHLPNTKRDYLVLARRLLEGIWDTKRSIYYSTGISKMGSWFQNNSRNQCLRQSSSSNPLNLL